MARDYSSRRNNPPDNNGKRKPAKRATPAARPVRQKKKPAPRNNSRGGNNGGSTSSIRAGAPGCIWLLCAVLLGVVGLSVYYIASRPAGHGPESVSVDLPDRTASDDSGRDTSGEDDSHAQPAGKTNTENEPKTQPRFSFYKMLPNYKVEVPAGQRAPQPVTDDNEPHEAEPAANTPAPAKSASGSEDDAHASRPASSSSAAGTGYVIQAGAFSTEDDADQRKAKLALLGVTADIVDVQTSSGKTVYRVQSDVLKSGDKAHSLAQRLQSHGIETMVRQAN